MNPEAIDIVSMDSPYGELRQISNEMPYSYELIFNEPMNVKDEGIVAIDYEILQPEESLSISLLDVKYDTVDGAWLMTTAGVEGL